MTIFRAPSGKILRTVGGKIARSLACCLPCNQNSCCAQFPDGNALAPMVIGCCYTCARVTLPEIIACGGDHPSHTIDLINSCQAFTGLFWESCPDELGHIRNEGFGIEFITRDGQCYIKGTYSARSLGACFASYESDPFDCNCESAPEGNVTLTKTFEVVSACATGVFPATITVSLKKTSTDCPTPPPNCQCSFRIVDGKLALNDDNRCNRPPGCANTICQTVAVPHKVAGDDADPDDYADPDNIPGECVTFEGAGTPCEAPDPLPEECDGEAMYTINDTVVPPVYNLANAEDMPEGCSPPIANGADATGIPARDGAGLCIVYCFPWDCPDTCAESTCILGASDGETNPGADILGATLAVGGPPNPQCPDGCDCSGTVDGGDGPEAVGAGVIVTAGIKAAGAGGTTRGEWFLEIPCSTDGEGF